MPIYIKPGMWLGTKKKLKGMLDLTDLIGKSSASDDQLYKFEGESIYSVDGVGGRLGYLLHTLTANQIPLFTSIILQMSSEENIVFNNIIGDNVTIKVFLGTELGGGIFNTIDIHSSETTEDLGTTRFIGTGITNKNTDFSGWPGGIPSMYFDVEAAGGGPAVQFVSGEYVAKVVAYYRIINIPII